MYLKLLHKKDPEITPIVNHIVRQFILLYRYQLKAR